MNFLSVFNEKARVSYGHASIAPAIVPPCEQNLGVQLPN
jgi:hypothetical protein